MRRRFAAIDVAVKNQDNREHDIFDSDDYLQDHGGMIATIRSLTGRDPKAWFGDSADPARPLVRSLAEEAARVVRTRVVNPRWIEAMQRHGYKGAFEMAATVDYLFGYDATANVVDDWMYEKVTAAYVADPDVRKFFEQSNPWALTSIAEQLLEAAERGMWAASAGGRRHPATGGARGRGLGGVAVTGLRFSAVVGQDEAKLALLARRRPAAAGRRAAARRQGLGQDDAGPWAGRCAAGRRALRRAAAGSHRGPGHRLDRPRRAAHQRPAPVPARPAGGGPRRGAVRRRDQPARRPPGRRPARRGGVGREPRRARRAVAHPPGPVRAGRVDEPRGGRAAAPAARPLRSRRRRAGGLDGRRAA